MTFRTRLFATSLAATAAGAHGRRRRSCRGRCAQSDGRADRATLVNEARLAAETLSHRRAATRAELDAEADALGRLIGARVTFVAPDGDGGRRFGAQRRGAPHAREPRRPSRDPAVAQPRDSASRAATAPRSPPTCSTSPFRCTTRRAAAGGGPAGAAADRASATSSPPCGRSALVAFGAGLLAALRARLGRIGHPEPPRARHRRSGRALRAPAISRCRSRDYGTDEIGNVARALDDSVREIGQRAADLEADRARMEAILSGMIEGVLVVNEQGRLQLVNAAARRMLRLQDALRRPALSRDRPPAGHRRTDRRGASRATPPKGSS